MTATRQSPDPDGAALRIPPLGRDPLPIHRVEPAPCSRACPAGIDVKAYVSLIAEGRFTEALEVIREQCPLPGICGRVCDHPCEAACARSDADEPIAIRALKRFVADFEPGTPTAPPTAPAERRTSRVAIVGSGPAGLTAAYDLARAGYPVTVLESEPEAGGMLRYGIADYRLPRDILDAEIDWIRAAGVEIETGRKLGRDFTLEDLQRDGYDAVLLAIGAWQGRRLRIPEANAVPAVEDAVTFLRRVSKGDRSHLEGKVLVIGGGSTAIEAARTARRLGARPVEIVYRRSRAELPAGEEEVEHAESEGIVVRYLHAPARVVHDEGRLKGLECLRVELGEADESGRRQPVPVPGSEILLDADHIYGALGQDADLDCLTDGEQERLTNGRWLEVDAKTYMTDLPGVFAAGDVVTGPATVAEAIGAAHRSAESIRTYLETGQPGVSTEPVSAAEYGLPDAAPAPANRLRPYVAPIDPGQEFAEVESPFSRDDAIREAARCLRCGLCTECRVCASSCTRRHLILRFEENGVTRYRVLRAPSRLSTTLTETTPAAAHAGVEADALALCPARILLRQELCRGCGLCVEVCPFEALALEPAEPTTLAPMESPPLTARLELERCRGCNLCTAVCPTGAAVSLVPPWPLALDDEPIVLIACEEQFANLGPDAIGPDVVLHPVRCVGEVNAGRLIDLLARGARQVRVAGCASGRCRFDHGDDLASDQIARARSILQRLGRDSDRIVCDGISARSGGVT